jgi:hypothetical protein
MRKWSNVAIGSRLLINFTLHLHQNENNSKFPAHEEVGGLQNHPEGNGEAINPKYHTGYLSMGYISKYLIR